MTDAELERFLEAVSHKTLTDYLGVSGGDAAQSALDRRLQWASRALSDPGNSAEAGFLLQHQDALRAHLRSSAHTADMDEEWIEFADAGSEQLEAGGWDSRSQPDQLESLDFGEIAGDPTPHPTPPREAPADRTPSPTPAPPASRRKSSRTPPPTPSISRRSRSSTPGPPPAPLPPRTGSPIPPAPDRTPGPFLERDEAPDLGDGPYAGRSGGPTPGRAQRHTPSPGPGAPGRQRTPTPSISRFGQRSASPVSGGTYPSRSFTPPPNRPQAPRGVGAATPTYSAPTPVPQGRGDSAVPPPNRGFDVQIHGAAEFMRSNDPYGTSSVVHDSELDRGRGLRTPRSPAARGTPADLPPRENDILANLRTSSRKGGKASSEQPQGGRLKIVPIVLALLVIGALSAGGYMVFQLGLVQELLEPLPSNTAPAPGDLYTPGRPPATPNDISSVSPTAPLPEPVQPPAADDEPEADPEPAPQSAPKPKPKPKPKPEPTTEGSAEGAPDNDDAATTSDGTASPGPSTAGDADPATPGDADPAAPGDADPATPGDADPSIPGEGTNGAPSEPAPEPEPAPPLAGAWKGTVGQLACIADFSQRGETVSGTITVAGQPFRVSGRHNIERGTLLLKGVSDPSIEFRAEVDGQRATGTARLGAGEMQQAWTLRK